MTSVPVTKVFRDPDPRHWRCLRCGDHISYPETGRPREYCGDTCRQAGNRLRRQHGWHWYKHQAWYPLYVAEERERAEQWERQQPERDRKRAEERAEAERKTAEEIRLRASMPPDVRQAYEKAEAAARRKSRELGGLTTVRLAIENLSLEHAELLRSTGRQIRLIDMSRKLEKLLRSALYAENEHEAIAMLTKARQLRAAGEDLDEVLTGMDLLRKLIGGKT